MKNKFVLLALGIICALGLAGCHGGESADDAAANKDVSKPGQKAPPGLSMGQQAPGSGGSGGGGATGPASVNTNP